MNSPKSRLKLDEALRAELKKPLGAVAERLTGSGSPLVCIGDIVSAQALKAGFVPKVIVYDGKCGREIVGPDPAFEAFDAFEARVENPAGGINPEAFEALEKALAREGSTKVRVDGEEDLLVLPAVMAAPDGATVAYGQPGEGIVEVTVNEESKSKVKELMERMIEG